MALHEEISRAHRDMLVDGLKRIFGDFNEEMLDRVVSRLQWVVLAGGEMLFAQGEQDDSLYFVISGRLRACRLDDAGDETVLGEVTRGETVGEMAFFTGNPRAATVRAVRDCVLVKFTGDVFRELLVAYPLVSLNMTRLVIERLQRASTRKPQMKPVAFAVAAVTPDVDALDFARRLAASLMAIGSTLVVTGQILGEWLGERNAAQAPPTDVDLGRRIARKLEQIEAEHQFVLFVADHNASEWTRRCLRHCDEVLLVARATQSSVLSPIEQECLRPGKDRDRVSQTLVLLHHESVRTPLGTAEWYAARSLSRHHHVRPGLDKDWAKLARMVSGTATGLVLSGGGARGFAHLGVIKALEEAGITYDVTGGTSIGGVMAAYAAMDLPADEVIAGARLAFKANPTGDINLVPLISLIGGKRLRQIIDSAVVAAMGHDIGIEDLWKRFYCVSSNYSTASEAVLTRGPLARSIRASVSIPGALPPVMMDGDLHIDGGSFNNFPTDVMNRLGAAQIIGVNLLRDRNVKYEMEDVPSPGKLLIDKARGKRNRLPGLTSLLLNTSMMYSYSRQGEAHRLVDLYFSPGVHRFGMLEWAQFDRIVKAGYDYARGELDRSGAAGLVTMPPMGGTPESFFGDLAVGAEISAGGVAQASLL